MICLHPGPAYTTNINIYYYEDPCISLVPCVVFVKQPSPASLMSMKAKSSKTTHSRIDFGVAMILVLEWVTQDFPCVTDPMHSIYISRTPNPMHSDYCQEMEGDAHAEYLSKYIKCWITRAWRIPSMLVQLENTVHFSD